MEVELKIEPSLAETRVVVRAPARTAEVDALLALLTAESGTLLGFREGRVSCCYGNCPHRPGHNASRRRRGW